MATPVPGTVAPRRCGAQAGGRTGGAAGSARRRDGGRLVPDAAGPRWTAQEDRHDRPDAHPPDPHRHPDPRRPVPHRRPDPRRPIPAAPSPGPAPLPLTAAQTPRLGRRALIHEHRVTLATPRRRYGPVARLLFVTMDLLYGRRGSLEKFMVLEVVARIPYRIWENAAYRALDRRHRDTGLAHRITERIVENREQQDNEQWHLLIIGELVAAQGGGRGRLRFGLLPWLMAVGYYHVAWLLFVLAPRASYRLNADFEDHAEHTYAEFVAAHPELEHLPHHSSFARRYGASGSVADLLRQIGHDERMHKLESERYLAAEPLR
ncbi:alternative oxidase [Pseudonocardia hydrocarbonoxydans]|uniref:Alternative oxidase n=1 Tax=Pseudonocardia hydrocarbonoxydans TaxID=76726 RepID=A0A4Y3WIM7_9PSEU|nr:alternative oxidase [Pseudonocardia hydrocarbonoxydans]GEC18787.1 hypothetical protein PHY01_10700 [Pseudonocardia hydrocarbonoxydans]